MNPISFDEYLGNWASTLPRINAPLKAFGEQNVDLGQFVLPKRFARMPTPLDEDENLRREFNSLIQEIVRVYLHGTVEECRHIRELLSGYKGVLHFMWIPAKLIKTPEDTDLYRAGLAMLSIEDQGHDPRDTLVSLEELCLAAKQAGIDTNRHLREVGMLSSDVDKYGMGSMRDIFLRSAT